MSTQQIAILATGDELIEGKTVNSNTAAIAEYLFSEGFNAGLQMTCGDKEQDIIDSLTYLSTHHDLIITIGGLGPTSDDRTRFAVGKFLNLPLVSHEAALKHIHALTKKEKLEQGDKQQALFPENTTLLPNPYGTAMGALITLNQYQVIMLPGPPRECLPMFQAQVLPRLKQNVNATICRLSWLVFGVREEYLGRILDQALSSFTQCETGYRLDTPYVECKIRCRIEDAQKIKALVEPLFAPHFLRSSTQKASDLLKQVLSQQTRTFTIQDNATGGLLQQLLSTPETFSTLRFVNTTENTADFECSGLETYWKQTNEPENTIHFKSNLKNAVIDTEAVFPFRSKLVINMAAEWLCAQFLTCLDGIHQR
jgi:nicotinamide-nucleotide amidase